tara:strand:- start:241 stop:381 length:141 start_codon:yes stop_codon:yes gene_type:complete
MNILPFDGNPEAYLTRPLPEGENLQKITPVQFAGEFDRLIVQEEFQ